MTSCGNWRSNVLNTVCLFVCLSAGEQNNSKNYGWIFAAFAELADYGLIDRILAG